MAVPTVAWWQKKTSATLSDRKNPLITDIDILLTEYHSAQKTDVQKQKILILILYYCMTWLVHKGDGSSSWRSKYVQQLRTEVETELRSPTMIQAVNQRVAGKGGVALKEDKIELLQPRDASAKFGLTATIDFRRMTAHNALTFADTFSKSTNLGGYASEIQSQMKGGHGAADYVDSLAMIAAGKAGGQNVKASLFYLSKQERKQNQLDLGSDDRFHLCGQDAPYQTAGTGGYKERKKDLFAMDNMWLLYVSGNTKAGVFHHSSFLSGRPVMCAGEIILDNGRISFINNLSGHYLPNTQNLLDCIGFLRDVYCIDVTAITVYDASTKTIWPSAADFKARGGIPQAKVMVAAK